MNFLAHAYLSGDNKDILLGNFAGDFIKGRQAMGTLDPAMIRGVELHRAIDEFTDNHPIVHQSKERLRSAYRHYAGVIVDVFYDHFLAANWEQYHDQSLEDFVANVYRTLEESMHIMPDGFTRMLPYMVKGNWLVGYRAVEGVHQALSGMARRTPYESKMEYASHDLKKHYDLFFDEFKRFFPALKEFVKDWID
jgi:acyl carrier protein phosphodiesterase